LLLYFGRRMAECYLDSLEKLTFLAWLPLTVVSATILALLTCDSKGVARFEDDDPDSPANRAKRAAREKLKKELREEEKKRQEGLQRGEFRQMDPNETVNEVPSNWGAAQAMLKAREGQDMKYFEPPKAVSSDTPIESPDHGRSPDPGKSPDKAKSPDQAKFRPRDDNETVNEVVSNWGAAQAMLQKKEGAMAPAKPPPPPAPPKPKGPPKGFRAADDNETVNEVVSNWGAAQAMLQKKEGIANVPPKPGTPKAPPKPKGPPKGFRAADDNETVNEVVSNWGAAQAMLQKREGEQKLRAPTPKKASTPPPPKFRPRDDNETVNEVVSNWGAAQAMLAKKAGPPPQKPQTPPAGGQRTPAQQPKPSTPAGMGKVRKANDFETIDECVSNWGAVQALAKKKGV
uniref:Signal peptide protein n=1 Tax=Haemonchus contortus TaxID=6289 RepID=A0A7I4YPB6_HAECO